MQQWEGYRVPQNVLFLVMKYAIYGCVTFLWKGESYI